MIYWPTIPLTFVFGPFYVCSRACHLLLPVLIPFILDWNDWGSFELLMWTAYLSVLFIWMIGICIVGRREFYLWHILPTWNKLKEFKIRCSYDDLSAAIFADYDRVTVQPIIRKMLIQRYGIDVTDIIVMYLECITVADEPE